MLWSSSPTLLPWSRFWTVLCRRRLNSCSRSSGSWTRRCRLSRPSQCPRSLWTVSRSVLGGSADRPDSHAHRFADRGADRRHSSSSWSCSWFPPRTEFCYVSSGLHRVVELSDANGRPYFWNRRSQATVWKTPPGVQVVWVGVKDEEGGTWYWHRRTHVTGYSLPPLPPE